MSTASLDIPFTRCLDAQGRPVGEPPRFALDPAALVELYRAMVLARAFDRKAVALQRTGRLGSFASALGEEAVSIGIASAMRDDDVLVPSFREHGAQLLRGVSPVDLFLYWGGDERGGASAGPHDDFPISVSVGSQVPHAVGVALALRLRHEQRAVVCVLGDGATSKGDVAEGLNMAGVWQVPAVFVVRNNGWAISVPVARQTAARTLAQKAVAAGIPGEQVDGNDVIAVRTVLERALAHARAGNGPALVEAVTYRLGDHTTSDDASRYRDDAEVTARWAEEPLLRLRGYLDGLGAWTKDDEEGLLHECAERVEAAARVYLEVPPPDPAAMFEFAFAEPPAALVAQRRELLGEG